MGRAVLRALLDGVARVEDEGSMSLFDGTPKQRVEVTYSQTLQHRTVQGTLSAGVGWLNLTLICASIMFFALATPLATELTIRYQFENELHRRQVCGDPEWAKTFTICSRVTADAARHKAPDGKPADDQAVK